MTLKIPHPRFLRADDCVLVLIDIQERLLAGLDQALGDALRENALLLVRCAKELGVPILVNEQYPQGLGSTLPELLAELGDRPRLPKKCFAATENPDFVKALFASGRRRVLLLGAETHVCVYQSVLGLLALDYEVHVAADAVASRFPKNHELGLAAMEAAGAVLESAESAVFQWLESAEAPKFKAVQKLIIATNP